MDEGSGRDRGQRPRGAAIDTLLAGAGLARPAPGRGEAGPRPLSPPLYPASVHVFSDLAQVDEVWEGRSPGHVYRRFGHPNGAALEELVAALEGGEAGVACASGMAALYAALLAGPGALGPGDCLVAQSGLYGGTQTLLTEELSARGIRTVLAKAPTREAFAAALAELDGQAVPVMLVETIANPSLEVADIPGLGEMARSRGSRLVVDNTFATPLGCRPLEQGASVVVHSTTKYLNGHSDVIGGLAVGCADWVAEARKMAITIGFTMSPFDAWLTLRGLRTLHLRFRRQVDNAAVIADWLGRHPAVRSALYPGRPEHPSHATAAEVLQEFGAMVAFDLAGGAAAVTSFLERLQAVCFSPSLGETVTSVTYPARTSHRSLSEAEKLAAGAGPGLVRLSAGTEDVRDVLADLEQALRG